MAASVWSGQASAVAALTDHQQRRRRLPRFCVWAIPQARGGGGDRQLLTCLLVRCQVAGDQGARVWVGWRSSVRAAPGLTSVRGRGWLRAGDVMFDGVIPLG